MLTELPYRRDAAVAYAKRWAMHRNPEYLDFEELGGDCTSFASQCIFAGCGVMNDTPTFGWYYYSANSRAPAWTGVPYLYNFLTGNHSGVGPYAIETGLERAEPGDIIQLGTAQNQFYHSPVVAAMDGNEILVCAHTYDALMRPLSSYQYDKARLLHILGARKYT